MTYILWMKVSRVLFHRLSCFCSSDHYICLNFVDFSKMLYFLMYIAQIKVESSLKF